MADAETGNRVREGRHPHHHDAATSVTATLRAHGQRVTPARLAVVDVLLDAESGHEHLTAETIAARIGERTPGVNPSTVYRTLDALAELELVRATKVGGGPAIYHLLAGGPAPTRTPHAHLHCRECGRLTDLRRAELAALDSFTDAVTERTGFSISVADSVLSGVCTDCAEGSAHAADGNDAD